MGEAKRRGTYQQRKAEGIERKRLEAIARQERIERQKREREELRAEAIELENQQRKARNSKSKLRSYQRTSIAISAATMGLSTALALTETYDE